ncbi:MAG: Dam family site-specific DNA-(adenine-N6)-methyltransferase [Bacilli bacterium]|nr:Dam family site-specific DNA-(adenine-N6)-methyltransferase [Bacilli bacterium]
MKSANIKNRRYLGSKAKLLGFIHDVVDQNVEEWSSFLDLFGGTGNVAWSFNLPNKKIIINDILESNYLSYISFFGKENIDEEKLIRIIDSYNHFETEEDNYFSINFGGTYFSDNNCRKIGFIREDIDSLFSNGKINERERAYLITSLIYAMDRIANTVGHYDAFRLNGDLSKKLELEALEIPPAATNELNEIYHEDSNKLVRHVEADVVYIDPPYNSRQYCDAYHLLENVASWEKPKVFGTARKMNRKGLKSSYCSVKAPLVFDDLIQAIKAKYILVSYNNMGTKGAGRSQARITDKQIISSLEKRGKVLVYETDFNQFSAGKTDITDHKERIFLCVVGGKGAPKIEEKCNVPFAKSPLNYTGGKYKLLPQLLSHFPYGDYQFIDVFGGGFNVGANVPYKTVFYNDKLSKVTRIVSLFYKYEAEEIIKKIDGIVLKYGLSNSTLNGYEYYGCDSANGLGKFNKKPYMRLRDDYNKRNRDSVLYDFMLLTLIVFSFNNQIRFNSDGLFNMPIGKRDFNNSIRKNLRNFSAMLHSKDITFLSEDFNKLVPERFVKPFYYCDPPYFLGDAAYNESNGWTDEDENRLLVFLKRLNDRGIKFALSNVLIHKGKEHKLLKSWAFENGFNVIYIKADYKNSNYQIKDKTLKTIEVLITNY